MDTEASILVNGIQQRGDAEAWNQFLRQYSPLIESWCRRNGLSAEDSADLTQDVFTRLVEKLAEFEHDPKKSFRAWLSTLAINLWRDRCKLRATRPLRGDPAGLHALIAPDDSAEREEVEFRRHLVARALQVMRKDFHATTWHAFWEHGVKGRPAREVGQESGLSENSVYAARFRVLRRLKEELYGKMWEL